MKQRVWLSMLLGLAPFVSGCGGSEGRIVGAEANTAFVTERPMIHLGAKEGLVRVRLDGSERARVFPTNRSVLDYTADGQLWILSDPDTNLYVADQGGTRERSVPSLARRVSQARLSPDGTRVAAVRHADFSLPQRDWKDDDAVYLVDTTTLEVTRLPAQNDSWALNPNWNAEGTEVYLAHESGGAQWVRVSDGSRRAVGEEVPPSRLPPQAGHLDSCPARSQTLESDDQGITLVSASGERKTLVTIEGRKRGFHDYEPSVSVRLFTPSCDHVLFGFSGTTWVVQVATGRVGKLASGAQPHFFLPESP
ncbi:hypothetical protein KRR26_34505 [Corallococcus sp. M34]|uniref:TolB family protein n=1 Tax=Citreicoccus inhibens TaxID=2849499 RepID=UPI001C219670|nr:hypothetical protein [Citreicoccus inhibens]MBU8900730.1 hypothetical protein [Citreicoccus inhibens]